MAVKLLLDSNKIYHKEFQGTKPGYDALQVDTFLDIVIKDYETFESYLTSSSREIEELKDRLSHVIDELNESKLENAKLKQKLDGIKSDQNASLNNLELLKRISALEKALSKAGINPNKVN